MAKILKKVNPLEAFITKQCHQNERLGFIEVDIRDNERNSTSFTPPSATWVMLNFHLLKVLESMLPKDQKNIATWSIVHSSKSDTCCFKIQNMEKGDHFGSRISFPHRLSALSRFKNKISKTVLSSLAINQ
jgi:hypothetical protein